MTAANLQNIPGLSFPEREAAPPVGPVPVGRDDDDLRVGQRHRHRLLPRPVDDARVRLRKAGRHA